MTESSPIRKRTYEERVDDTAGCLAAIRQAVREAVLQHKIAGNPVAVWRDGAVHWVQPEDIPGPDAPVRPDP